MDSKDKKNTPLNHIGDASMYNRHVWLCECNICKSNFYSEKTTMICDSCLKSKNREGALDKVLNNRSNS